MLGVVINGFHTFEDFGLGWLQGGFELSEPEIQTHYVEVEGMDGSLDLTEDLSGRPVYKDRTLKLTFDSPAGTYEAYTALCSRIDSRLHGRRCEITLDTDPDWFYLGRGKWSHTKDADGVETHVFTATVKPYKYYKDMTVRTVNVDGTADVVLENSMAPATPFFTTVDKDMRVQQGSAEYSVLPGTDMEIYGITLLEGSNVLTFTGTGTVTIQYREGML